MTKQAIQQLRSQFVDKTSLGKNTLKSELETLFKESTTSIISPNEMSKLKKYIDSKPSHGRVQFDEFLLDLILGKNEEEDNEDY